MNKMDNIVNQINSKFGELALVRASDIKQGEVERLSTGSLYLDKLLGTNTKSGNSGLPLGRIVELYGKPSSGKSSLCYKMVVEAQKRGLQCAWFDCEQSFERERAQAVGVDVSKLFYTQETLGERIFEMISEMLRQESVDVVVIDSVASMIPIAELEKSMEDSTGMAEVARMMSRGLRKLTALNKTQKALIVFINQLRTNPSASYGANPEYTPGGKALLYYTSIRLELRAGLPIVGKGKKIIGQPVKFKIAKNKTSDPLLTGSFNFMYDGTIDQVDELISIGELEGSIKRKGSYYLINDKQFHGKEELDLALKADQALFEEAKLLVFGAKTQNPSL